LRLQATLGARLGSILRLHATPGARLGSILRLQATPGARLGSILRLQATLGARLGSILRPQSPSALASLVFEVSDYLNTMKGGSSRCWIYSIHFPFSF
jgi:hypothetical protein